MEIADNAGQGISLAGDVRYGLLGKLLSPRLTNGNAVVRTFTNIWEEEQAEVLPLKHGMFLFKFPGEQQRSSILRRSPSLFKGDPLMTIPFDPSLSLNDHDFSKILYWVRIHELPLNMVTVDIAALIGSRFGKLIVVDTRHNLGNLGEFFRLRVEIVVHNPLLRCVTVGKHADGRTRICPVQFEKLNKFCFNCGRLGHEIDLCPQTRDVNATTTPYGPWMRAPMDTRRPPPYQHKGIVYCEVNTALTTISQQVPSTVPMANPGGGISEKELVELAQIANDLGVNSSMFADPVVVSTEVEACGQKPMQPVLQAGIETGSSSKDNDPSHAGHTDLVIAGVEIGTMAADPILHKNKMVLAVDPDPGSLGKMNSLATSSSILQVQEIEHGTPKVVHTDAGPPVSKGDAQFLASRITNPAVEPTVKLCPAVRHVVESRAAMESNMESRKAVEPAVVSRKAVEPVVERHKAMEPAVEPRNAAQGLKPHKEISWGTTLSDGIIKKGSISHRRRSLPPSESSKCDTDDAARANKRSRQGKHRSSSSSKRSRSGTDLDDAMKNKELGLEMAEAGEQPRPEH
ncbi:hypothetical protein V6N13_074732 [Hibiscus sabdariffa]